MIKQIRKLKRNFKKIQRLEAREALRLGLSFTHTQIKIRPRARLVSKFIVVLALLFAISSPTAAYLDRKRGDIVIGGQQILIAKQAAPADEDNHIDQTVLAHKSPFEFHNPVGEGYISQGFTGYHRANDFVAPFGSAVHAMGEGTVEFAGMTHDGHGNMIVIDHGNDLKSTYAHLGRIYAGAGNKVDGKTTIGTVGLTGRTTGAHVHMEIIDNETFVDPSGILPQ